jgi:hypothetical protein
MGEITVLARPKQEMPMVWHHAPGEDAHRYAFLHFSEDALERRVVPVVFKDPPFSIGSIKDVVYEPSRRGSQRPWHGPEKRTTGGTVDRKGLGPFSVKRVLTPFRS